MCEAFTLYAGPVSLVFMYAAFTFGTIPIRRSRSYCPDVVLLVYYSKRIFDIVHKLKRILYNE